MRIAANVVDREPRPRGAGRGAGDRRLGSSGRVALVGAGPGDPELLTLRALGRIRDADVVLHDRLVDDRILDLAHPHALVLDVGKRRGEGPWVQAAINREMLRHAGAGRSVVRLKSGDPMVFGRADEELDALEEAGIQFEVVPGISAAAAGASQLASSLTRRGRNSAVTFITARSARGRVEHEWAALAHPDAVFVVYMGAGTAGFLKRRLLQHGRPATTPVTIAFDVSRATETVVSGPLRDLDTLSKSHADGRPAIIFVGIAPRSYNHPLATWSSLSAMTRVNRHGAGEEA